MHANVTDTGLKTNSFNSCFSVDIIHHIGNVSLLYKEVSRILKPGKYWCAYEPYNEGMAGVMRRLFHHEDEAKKGLKEILHGHEKYFILKETRVLENRFYPSIHNYEKRKWITFIPTPFKWKILLIFQNKKSK